jgi:hypothetical protein
VGSSIAALTDCFILGIAIFAALLPRHTPPAEWSEAGRYITGVTEDGETEIRDGWEEEEEGRSGISMKGSVVAAGKDSIYLLLGSFKVGLW